ncbi:MAG: Gfo/Idh/MocA family protein [Stellaceae bacterium]
MTRAAPGENRPKPFRRINVGIIGTGWCGGIRAHACAANPLVEGLYIAENKPARLAEIAAQTHPVKATEEWRELLDIKAIDAVYISATPETVHYPMARDCLLAGKHVFLEKPIAMNLGEADELIALARRNQLKFTIGYSQRFNPKQAYIKQCVADGTLGEPVSAMVSRHLNRGLGDKINTRTRLSPAAMEATHDIDWVLWCLSPANPVRVYCQSVSKVNRARNNTPDCCWITVTMDSGVIFTIGAGWILPPAYPNFSTTQIEFIGTEGALLIDDSHKDVALMTMKNGLVYPLSTMPGESVGHVYAGPMERETDHFAAAVAYDRPVLVSPEEARQVMEVYVAADLSAERNEPVSLPLREGDNRLASGD